MLCAVTTRGSYWIAFCVRPKLVFDSSTHGDIKNICELQQIDSDIREFGCHLVAVILYVLADLIIAEPLEMLQQLARFNRDRNSEILRGMIWLPRTFGAKRAKPIRDGFE